MIELTPGQRQPLFELVSYQQKSGREQVFAVRSGWEAEIVAWDGLSEQAPIVTVPRELAELWSQKDLVHLSTRSLGGGPFAYDVQSIVLREEALKYESWMRQPPIVRSLVTLWRSLVEDVPSLVWGIVGGVVGSIATTAVSRWMGLT
jgi:hypothetical protein